MRRPHPGPGRRQRAAAVLLVVACLGTAVPPVAAEATAPYAPPVEAPVSDPFREPASPYAAGNRGLDYETAPGTEVRAAAPGEVTFAGQVGGGLHVVVLHPDGLRTSYSFLAAVAVRRGQVVGRGEVVGTSGASVHFGARAGERYVDPALLLRGGPVEIHLIPIEDRAPKPVATERRWLQKTLARSGALADAAGAVAAWLADRSAGAAVATARRRLVGPVLVARALAEARRGFRELADDQEGCTPAAAPPPPRPPERRIVVLVAGYGSSGAAAEVLDVDTAALGYDDADRVQFSYAGGRVPGVGSLTGVPTAGYGPADSMGDLREAGERLRSLLAGIADAHPGVAVDVVAHSQGGIVARAALAEPVAGLPVERLVTLGSPHRGAPLATLARQLGLVDGDSVLADGVTGATGGGVEPAAPAVAQLAEGSSLLESLARRPPGPEVAVTSIAASGDLVVPALSSTLAGATNVLVPVGGLTGHAELPGSSEAARELALVLTGAGPTCTTTAVLAAGTATAAAIAAVEHGAGGLAGPTVRLVDDVAVAVAGVLAAVGG
ncbi:MAG: peptidoglycan DD-metalloendopeptidase family protein [Acidimicrobiales bacterium]